MGAEEEGRAPPKANRRKKNLGSSGREKALAWLEREGEVALEPGLTPTGPRRMLGGSVILP